MLFEPREGRVHRAPGESPRTIQTDAPAEDNLSDVDTIMTALVNATKPSKSQQAKTRRHAWALP